MRFIEGGEFPDAPERLAGFVGGIGAASDRETVRQMARLFERPAFYTAMGEESCLPAFKQAITDTIQALNTGIWQTRDGQLIERIPTRHHLRDERLRERMTEVERGLARLRATYDALFRSGKLRVCGCQKVDCPILFMDPEAVRELERVRDDCTSEFRAVCSALGVTLNLGWR